MSQQSWDPDRYAANARFVAELGTPVVELLAPRRGERILDLACGDGVLTAELAGLRCRVIGVDASPELTRAAIDRGIDARVMNGEALDFDAEFDAVFSNAALHWMKRADAVIAGVRRALKPGGRFVAEMGGAGNVRTIVAALYRALDRRGVDGRPFNPWYFPTVEEYQSRLETAGFAVSTIALIPRPTALPGDVVGWLETFAESFCKALPQSEHRGFLAEVQEILRPELCDATGRWTADYVRLRFAAAKQA